MATIRKRRWTHKGDTKEAWVVAYTDRSGKRRLKTLPTKKAADAERLRIEVEIEKGVHVPASQSVTVAKALDLFLDRCEERVRVKDRLRPRTVRNFRGQIDRHIRPTIGARLLSDLTVRALQEWVDQLAYGERALKKAHIQNLVMVLQLALKNAFRLGLVAHNPVREADLSIPGRTTSAVQIPSKDEIRLLVDHAGVNMGQTGGVAKWQRPMILTALLTGLRQGELRALRWEDVDFDQAVIRVRRAADNIGYCDEPKSAAGIRDVPMASGLALELKKWKLLSQKLSGGGLVFVGNRGNMVEPGSIQNSWARLQRRVLPDVVPFNRPRPGAMQPAKYKFHALRHAAASLFIEEGLKPKRVQQIMGHASIQMTFDTYGHLFDDPKGVTAAVENISAAVLR